MKKPSPKSTPKKPSVGKPKSSAKAKSKGRFKKIALGTLLVLLVLVLLMPVAHYFVFPQQTRAILIDYSSFQKEGRLYFAPKTPRKTIDTLDDLVAQAGRRVDRFWGGKTCDPKVIYCESAGDFEKFGSANPVPAVTIMKLGSYIVLSKDGLDLDVIAHEMSHAELYERIGFYAQEFKIPTWFSEGLAMQCDDRAIYSEDTLQAKSDNFKNLPDVKQLTSAAEFFAGTQAEVMLNFMTAKHEVKGWYAPEKLQSFISKMQAGASFEEAYAPKPRQ